MGENTGFPKHLDRKISIGEKNESGDYDVSLSSERPVERFFGEEILVHSSDAINMERANDGLPFLVNHDLSTLIGRIFDFRLVDGKTRGRLVFDSEDPDAQLWKGKLDRKIARDFSVRYEVNDHEVIEKKGQAEQFRITRWTPVEASIVSVAADPTVGMGRSLHKEENLMLENEGADLNVVDFRAEHQSAYEQGQKEGAKLAAQRIAAIESEYAGLRTAYRDKPIFVALKRRSIQEGTGIEQFRSQILSLINTEPAEAISRPATEDARSMTAPGDDDMDKWVKGATEALSFRFGLETGEEASRAMDTNPFGGLTLMELGRSYLQRRGVPAGGLSPSDVAGACLQHPGVVGCAHFKRGAIISHTSSDFTNVLANIAWKMIGVGYTQANETWRPIVRVINMTDYKEGKIPNLLAFSNLDELPDSDEYKMGTIGDVGERIAIRKFGKLFLFSRAAILNDDQRVFTDIPRMMGGAAARKTGDLVWTDIVVGNPTLTQNSNAFFSSGNNNLAASGAPPSVTTLDAAYAKMGRQTVAAPSPDDPNATATLNIEPRFIAVPPELAGTAQVLTTAMQQAMAPGATSGTTALEAQNRFTQLVPISEPRLTSTKAWYLFVNPTENLVDSITVAFLNGQQTPFLEQKMGFEQDGVQYKVRLEAAAAAVAYQGVYKDPGV